MTVVVCGQSNHMVVGPAVRRQRTSIIYRKLKTSEGPRPQTSDLSWTSSLRAQFSAGCADMPGVNVLPVVGLADVLAHTACPKMIPFFAISNHRQIIFMLLLFLVSHLPNAQHHTYQLGQRSTIKNSITKSNTSIPLTPFSIPSFIIDPNTSVSKH